MSSGLFNLYEGIFWVMLGLVVLVLLLSKRLPDEFHKLGVLSSIVLITFGISDFLQSKLGSFFQEGLEWLLIWKYVCVAGLVYMIVWYLWIRLNAK